MSNISLFHNNILSPSTVSGTELESLSSARFLSDDLLSFKMTATGSHTRIEIDQPGSAVLPFDFFILADHSLSGGEAIVTTYPTASRVSPTVAFSGTLTFDDPNIVDLGSVPTNTQFVDVELTTSGSQKLSIGELMLASKFDSPQRPSLGITTRYIPRRTVIDKPNGERISVRHGGTIRHKNYTIPGLTLEEASEWVDLFIQGEGTELVILLDDEGETYPALLNKELQGDTLARRVDIGLEFTEVKL